MNRDYSGQFDNQIDKNRDREILAKNTEVILKNPKSRMLEKDFKDIFPIEEIENDQKIVSRLEDKFHEQIEHLSPTERENIKNGEKLGHVLEIIIAEEGEKYEWAGKGAYFVRTSRYDDVINGVDIIIEFDTESGQLPRVGLGVDTSRNKDVAVVYDKIHRNIDKLLQQNNIVHVQYLKKIPTIPNNIYSYIFVV